MLSRLILLAILVLASSTVARAQDTTVVQTLTFDSVGRAGYYKFLDENAGSIERVIMQYRMRCVQGAIRTNREMTKGCGEWDYNCETYITDSSRVDSVKTDAGYQYWPQKFEIMSFVTPYGIGLDLGKEGKMWEFDVTDYLPILKGSKILSVERGAWQEELDIRFLFIKGTPSRNVLNIEQLWPATEENYQNIQSDKRFQPISVVGNAQAKEFKLRSMITGHGQEGEFIPRMHSITVNGEKFEHEVWMQCSENPVYPQGGTWIYARAGWCPGAPSLLTEYDVTAQMFAGEPNQIDYTVASGSGDSRYLVNNQLVSYGAPNFTRDAAVVEVVRPSDRVEFARFNPAATQPVVTIKNNGSEMLTSLTIHYGVAGTAVNTFEWKGALAFLDTERVTLPTPATWGDLATNTFNVHVAQPNGQSDEYANNDGFSSKFVKAPVLTSGVIVRYKTNNVPDQNWYQIFDRTGKIVHENFDAQEAGVTYFDSLVLSPGPYTFSFHDEGENGINFWATPDDGAGTIALRKNRLSTGSAIKTFNPDFGKFVNYDFIVPGVASVGDQSGVLKSVRVFPNPVSSVLSVDLKGYENESFSYTISDVLGKQLLSGELRNGEIDVSSILSGSYFLELLSRDGATHIPFVKE